MNDAAKEKLLTNMANNLPALRVKAGLTQSKLAEMIGISRQTLGSIETKKRTMAWSTFLSCFLVFYKNPDTAPMLKLFEVCTEELENYLMSNE